MPSHFSKHHTCFSILSLAEFEQIDDENFGDGIIEIYLLLSGSATMVSQGFHTLLTSHNLLFIDSGKCYKASIKKGTEGYVIRFNKALLYNSNEEFNYSYFPAIQNLILRREVLKVETSFLSEMKKLCEMMQREFENENEFKPQILSSFLNIFLLHLMRKSKILTYNTSSKSGLMLLGKFNALLEQKFKTNKKVAEYAALLFVTPNYLNQIVKETTGNSVSFLIRQRIILEAVRMAKITGASMKEVAYDLGFNDHAHFSKFFKKVAGNNFSDIKNSLSTRQWFSATTAIGPL